MIVVALTGLPVTPVSKSPRYTCSPAPAGILFALIGSHIQDRIALMALPCVRALDVKNFKISVSSRSAIASVISRPMLFINAFMATLGIIQTFTPPFAPTALSIKHPASIDSISPVMSTCAVLICGTCETFCRSSRNLMSDAPALLLNPYNT